jgi:hypothetical protein
MGSSAITMDWLRERGFVPDGKGGWHKPEQAAAVAPAIPSAAVCERPTGRASASNEPHAKMNKTESAYAAHLETLRRVGEIVKWDFEPEKLRLADATFYTPDFRIQWPDGSISFDEVKGHWEDDARVKIKVAARLHPYQFRAVQRDGNGWKYENFNNA